METRSSFKYFDEFSNNYRIKKAIVNVRTGLTREYIPQKSKPFAGQN